MQLVRDEDQPATVVGELAQRGEQIVDLGRGQHRGRLVEHEHLGVAVQRLEDLGALALADGELPDVRVRIDLQAVPLGHLGEALLDRVHVGEAHPAAQPSATFSATVSVGTSMKCWWIMPMPWRIASVGDVIVTSWPLRKMVPSSGWYNPYRIFIRVLLPAPFSPEEGVHLTRQHRQVDAVVGDDAGEPLGDAAHLQHRCHRRFTRCGCCRVGLHHVLLFTIE